ncbi:MAG TPA: hypothetical protein VNW46_17555 [Gemmatimonadaceae bacterium]|jgi:hypothetical protein|nr:hypothetical protein [Gemmatimonadaceae bacterium]
MTKRLTADQQALLEVLRDRARLIVDFVLSVEEAPSIQMLRPIVEDCATAGNLHGMKMLVRDLDEMSLALAPHHREGLEALLAARLGVDKDAERLAWRERVHHALRRGTVASEKERQRLERYVEMLEATGGDPAEIAAVTRLLAAGE